MNSKDVLVKIMRRSNTERGIRIIKPSHDLSEGHIKKADHNLIVMTDMKKLGHEDWIAITAYYAMYHSTMALFAKIGIESKDHAATASALDYFFGRDIGKELLKKFQIAGERKSRIERLVIEPKYINNLWKAKREREKAQYGISLSYTESISMVNDARDFVTRMKLVMADMDEIIVKELVKKAKDLSDKASTI